MGVSPGWAYSKQCRHHFTKHNVPPAAGLFATVGDRKLRERAHFSECAGRYGKSQGRNEDDLCHRTLPQQTVFAVCRKARFIAVTGITICRAGGVIPSIGGLPQRERYRSIWQATLPRLA